MKFLGAAALLAALPLALADTPLSNVTPGGPMIPAGTPTSISTATASSTTGTGSTTTASSSSASSVTSTSTTSSSTTSTTSSTTSSTTTTTSATSTSSSSSVPTTTTTTTIPVITTTASIPPVTMTSVQVVGGGQGTGAPATDAAAPTSTAGLRNDAPSLHGGVQAAAVAALVAVCGFMGTL